LRCSKNPEEPEEKKDVAEEHRNDPETPSVGDGSSSWSWVDFMSHM
jgi:hypothetical protein